MIYTNKDTIITESTSSNTAKTNRIVLKETDRIRTSFEPDLIKNSKNPERCVSGRLIHERKKKAETDFPTDNISKNDIRVGDALIISLDTTETKNLFDGLKDRYDLYSSTEEIRMGTTRYAKIDDSTNELLWKIKELKSSGKFSNDQIMKIMELLTGMLESDETEEFSKKISNVQTSLNLNRLKTVREKFAKKARENKEEVWQQFFKENQWLLSLLFQTPFTLFQSKAYVGGKEISNSGGKIVDFLYANDATQNIALIEIKTPQAKLLGRQYRDGVYSASDELSGGINQLLSYKQSLLTEYELVERQHKKALNPTCILIIGVTAEFKKDENKISSFELFRSSLNSVVVVTFDELYYKLQNLISILEKKN